MMDDAQFDVVLHPFPPRVRPGPVHVDRLGTWPTLLPDGEPGGTTGVGFDGALAALESLERAYTEPDGSFVWVGEGPAGRWQVDGNAWERSGEILSVDARGRCPTEHLRRFLAVWHRPGDRLVVELARAGVFLDEETFLRHARAAAGPRP